MLKIRNKLKYEIGYEQFRSELRKGLEIQFLLCECYSNVIIEIQRALWEASIDYKKAFDRVKLAELFKEHSKHGKDLKSLYLKQLTTFRIYKHQGDWISVRRGVRQGCILSPDLFSLRG